MKLSLRRKIAIDLGTTSVLVYTRGKGVILKEPSVVAYDRFTDKIVAVGLEAKEMIGRTPGNIAAIRPMKDGVIVDYNSTEKMLKHFLRKSVGKSLIKPDVIICVPSEATQVQKRAVMQAASKAGSNNIHLIEEPLAAGIGSGIQVSDPGGSMVVDVGGGTTDIAVISMGGIVVSASIKSAGDACDQAIIDFVRKTHNVIIGDRTAEEIKITLGSTLNQDRSSFRAKGRNLFNGLPTQVELGPRDVEFAMSRPIESIVETVHKVLSNTPPELASDLYERGIILTGGGALISGLAEKIQDRIGIKVHVDENPLTSVVRGAGKALNWINKLNSIEDNQFDLTRKEIARKEKLRRR
ncbi:MAG: rod shape-determining protein [Tissierellia bacterium]|nr:rod shape-determining protein [Tissierellia bacterium]